MVKRIVWSYGGGTQSIAIALLIAQGRLPKPDIIVFADTGREASETFEYTTTYVAPLLAQHGLTIETATHDLSTVDLYSHKGKLLIPAFSDSGKLPTFCSSEWKKYVVRRYLVRQHGINPRKESVIVWMGMSTDEVERLKPSGANWIENHWPLCDMPTSAHYGITMSRLACTLLVEQYGWPSPPKSSCWMCPHRTNAQWQDLKEHHPRDFAQAVLFQQRISESNMTTYGVPLYLHKARKPLDEIDFAQQDDDQLDFGCDTGFCFV